MLILTNLYKADQELFKKYIGDLDKCQVEILEVEHYPDGSVMVHMKGPGTQWLPQPH